MESKIMYECMMCGMYKIYPSDICLSCKEEIKESEEMQDRLEQKGHTPHCAARIVWGDGECECQELIQCNAMSF